MAGSAWELSGLEGAGIWESLHGFSMCCRRGGRLHLLGPRTVKDAVGDMLPETELPSVPLLTSPPGLPLTIFNWYLKPEKNWFSPGSTDAVALFFSLPLLPITVLAWKHDAPWTNYLEVDGRFWSSLLMFPISPCTQPQPLCLAFSPLIFMVLNKQKRAFVENPYMSPKKNIPLTSQRPASSIICLWKVPSITLLNLE